MKKAYEDHDAFFEGVDLSMYKGRAVLK